MPTYEYQCKACKHEFERVQRITDDPVKTCPKCKKRQVQRLISQTSFVLKGGGWYNDLYASKKAAKDGAEKGASSDAPAKDAKDTKETKSSGSDGKESSSSKSSKESKKSKGSKAAA